MLIILHIFNEIQWQHVLDVLVLSSMYGNVQPFADPTDTSNAGQ